MGWEGHIFKVDLDGSGYNRTTIKQEKNTKRLFDIICSFLLLCKENKKINITAVS